MASSSGISYKDNPTVDIQVADSASSDSFGGFRTSTPFGLLANKNVGDKNRNVWDEIIEGVIIVYSGLTGTFTNGEQIRGLLPLGYIAMGTITTDNGSTTMVISCDHNDFQVGDTITGQTSGATATVVSANTGSNIQHDYNTSSVTLTTGLNATDRAVRQFHRYLIYVPGKGQHILQTFVLGAAKTNVVKRVGYFDDNDGLFLEQTGTDIAFVLRTSTSGSPVDTRITQSNWNLDRLDGTDDSMITLDITKTQILAIDFQWLGVGRVRFGFNIDGRTIYAHQILNANVKDTVYMRTPSLPVRYEIANTGVPASATSMSEICCSVSSEGGYELPGLEFSIPLVWTNQRAVTARTPVLAIRLKAEAPAGQPNRKTAKFLDAGAFIRTNDCAVEIVHVHDPYDITATWKDVGGGSTIEYSTDISAVKGRPSHVVDADAKEAGGGTAKGGSAIFAAQGINEHSFISQNYDSTNSQMFVVYASPRTGTSDVLPNLTWIELG